MRAVASPMTPASPPIHARASIWNGSHGPMPPVMIADTAIAHSPRSRPKRGPNAAPASTMRKKIPLPPPGSPSRRSSPALAARTPRIATDAPVIVPRRTSIAIAATTSPPTTAATRGASPAWAALGSAVPGSQNG